MGALIVGLHDLQFIQHYLPNRLPNLQDLLKDDPVRVSSSKSQEVLI